MAGFTLADTGIIKKGKNEHHAATYLETPIRERNMARASPPHVVR